MPSLVSTVAACLPLLLCCGADQSLVAQLQSLHALHQEGGLTSPEFAAAKARLLAAPQTQTTAPPSLSVVDYGADPSGRNDSTVAINKAVAAASARVTEPCQPVYLCGLSVPTLFFPAGEYVFRAIIRSTTD